MSIQNTELKTALIHHLEMFLLELGGDFTFAGRQRRLGAATQASQTTGFVLNWLAYHQITRVALRATVTAGAATVAGTPVTFSLGMTAANYLPANVGGRRIWRDEKSSRFRGKIPRLTVRILS